MVRANEPLGKGSAVGEGSETGKGDRMGILGPGAVPQQLGLVSDVDHDGDADLKDFYGIQWVFVTP